MDVNQICDLIDREFKGKAIGENQCMYKTLDGKKCFIGLFIPEGHPAQGYLGTAGELLNEYPSLLELMPSQDFNTLDTLQIAHDTMDGKLTLDQQKQYLKESVRELILT